MAVKLIILCLVTLATAKKITETIILTEDEPTAEISINMNGEADHKGEWTIYAADATTLYLDCPYVEMPPSKFCKLGYIKIDIEGYYTDKVCSSDALFLKFDFEDHEKLGIEFRTKVGRTGSLRCKVSYNKKIPCGNRNRQRIVGGEETDPNEYPWQGALLNRGIFCGGSLIHPSWFLTAAHCIPPMKSTYGVNVVMGAHYLNFPNITLEEPAQLLRVTEIFVHEEYDHITNDNDIALLRLNTPADISNPEVGLICLPFGIEDYDIDGANATAIGWGQTSYGGDLSDNLMEVVLPVLLTESCRELYRTDIITDNMICTYEPRKSPCHGDSGGPLSIDFWDTSVQIGVVSWGRGCVDSVYTKVSNYLDWILDITGRDGDSIKPYGF